MKIPLFISVLILLPFCSLSANNEVNVIPDDYFIDLECRELAKEANGADNIVKTIDSLCIQKKQGTVSESQWLFEMDSIARSIQNETSNCTNCMTKILKTRQPIPSDFSVYALALFPSPELIQNPTWIFKFIKTFSSFGDSIGDSNAAIWLGGRYNNYIDVERNKKYCIKYDLSFNNGPYIVITKNRPDLHKKGDEFIFIKLNGISNERIVRLLNIIEEDLRNNRNIRKRTLLFEEVKNRMLTFAENNKQELKDIIIKLVD